MQGTILRTGIDQTGTMRTAHNTAVALGALRAFCASVFRHMCIINAIVEVDDAEDLFNLAAKYEIMRDDNGVDGLQHVVQRVFESADGSPHIDQAHHSALAEVMQDYTRAHAAAINGTEAVRQYQTSIMLPYVTDVGALEGAIISDNDAEVYMRNVEHCCCLYETNRRTGPLYDMLADAMQ